MRSSPGAGSSRCAPAAARSSWMWLNAVAHGDPERLVWLASRPAAWGPHRSGSASGASTTARRRFRSYPFTLGVASGDLMPDGVVLWTRLAPEPLALHGRRGMSEEPVNVLWQVAADERFDDVVRAGRAGAERRPGRPGHVLQRCQRPSRAVLQPRPRLDALRRDTEPVADDVPRRLQGAQPGRECLFARDLRRRGRSPGRSAREAVLTGDGPWCRPGAARTGGGKPGAPRTAGTARRSPSGP